jgi:2-dehydropantoate 2-reductase
LVLSLQNGVDNAERVRSAAKIGAVPAVVYVAVAISEPGRIRHSGRGDLIIGDSTGSKNGRDLSAIAATFERATIPCRVSGNIEADLWTKMIMNCAYNAISALGRSQYGPIVQNPWARGVMTQVTEEAIAVAGAAGVRLPDGMVEAVLKLAETMSGATSSTAQDIARGSRTEIDSLNGYVVRLGAQLGVAAPVNQTLHGLVKLLEESTRVRGGIC